MKEEIKKIGWISELLSVGLAISIGFLWYNGFEATVIFLITYMIISIAARQAKRYGY